MNISKSDYVIIGTADHKARFMIKVSGTDGDVVRGVDSRFPHIEKLRTLVEVTRTEVILNLGPSPRPGRVYGVDTSSLYVGYKDHKHFGPIHFFYKISKGQRKALFTAFNRLYKRLEKLRLHNVVNDNIVYEVYSKNGGGSMLGAYAIPKTEDVPSRLLFYPEKAPESDYVYILAHELAHHLHATYCNTPEINSAWIKLYNTSILQTPVDKELSANILNQLIESQERPSRFSRVGLVEDADRLAYSWIMRCIKQTHGLSVKDLDQLAEAGFYEEIRNVWPSKVTPKKELNPIISTYACKNFRETFAEAFAFYLVGMKLPKDVTKLVERTISYCRVQLK